ncbi:MAG: M56 family metallopeptidase [Thermoguttaceae bacterium]
MFFSADYLSEPLLYCLLRATLFICVGFGLVEGLLRIFKASSATLRQICWFSVLLLGWIWFRPVLTILPNCNYAELNQSFLSFDSIFKSNYSPKQIFAGLLSEGIIKSICQLLVITWGLGIVYVIIRSCRQNAALSNMYSNCVEPTTLWREQWEKLLKFECSGNQTPMRVSTYFGPCLVSRCFGLLGYILIVPMELWKKLDTNERLSVLKVELAHLKRRDSLKILLARILVVPQWFNPLAWIVLRKFENAVWLASDEYVCKQSEQMTFNLRSALDIAQNSPKKSSVQSLFSSGSGNLGEDNNNYGFSANILASRLENIAAFQNGNLSNHTFMKKVWFVSILSMMFLALVVKIQPADSNNQNLAEINAGDTNNSDIGTESGQTTNYFFETGPNGFARTGNNDNGKSTSGDAITGIIHGSDTGHARPQVVPQVASETVSDISPEYLTFSVTPNTDITDNVLEVPLPIDSETNGSASSVVTLTPNTAETNVKQVNMTGHSDTAIHSAELSASMTPDSGLSHNPEIIDYSELSGTLNNGVGEVANNTNLSGFDLPTAAHKTVTGANSNQVAESEMTSNSAATKCEEFVSQLITHDFKSKVFVDEDGKPVSNPAVLLLINKLDSFLREGDVNDTLEMINAVNDTRTKFALLLELADQLTSQTQGRTDTALFNEDDLFKSVEKINTILASALEVIPSIKNPVVRDKAYSAAATRISFYVGDFRQAKEIIGKINNPLLKSNMLMQLSELQRTNDPQDATDTFQLAKTALKEAIKNGEVDSTHTETVQSTGIQQAPVISSGEQLPKKR